MNELPLSAEMPSEITPALVLRQIAPRPRKASETFQPIEQLLSRFDRIAPLRDCA